MKKKMMKSVGVITLLISMHSAFLLHGQNIIELDPFATGFSVPVKIAHAGDDRLFIVEKAGRIRIVDTTGVISADPFLNITGIVNSVANERGLLGLAFHPFYADNGYFYVNYTNAGGHTVVARYTRDSTDADMADPASAKIILTIEQPFNNHNGGDLAFGPDGYLYIGTGDGGSGGDPGNRAQNPMDLLGKMLRIDIDNGDPYSIPEDNPFAFDDFTLDEIWALGLRNPWRYSFDRETGDLWIADVGQSSWEEVNFQPAESAGAENYGWRCREGFAVFNNADCPPQEAFTDPVYAYGHVGFQCTGSVTGGYVYRGSRNTYLAGKYILADYCTGVFRALDLDQSGNAEAEVLGQFDPRVYTSFGEDASGELYVASGAGTIFRIRALVSSVSETAQTRLWVSPNPVSDRFAIRSTEDLNCDYEIMTLHGIVVASGSSVTNQWIDASQFSDGFYLLRLRYGQSEHSIVKLSVIR